MARISNATLNQHLPRCLLNKKKTERTVLTTLINMHVLGTPYKFLFTLLQVLKSSKKATVERPTVINPLDILPTIFLIYVIYMFYVFSVEGASQSLHI